MIITLLPERAHPRPLPSPPTSHRLHTHQPGGRLPFRNCGDEAHAGVGRPGLEWLHNVDTRRRGNAQHATAAGDSLLDGLRRGHGVPLCAIGRQRLGEQPVTALSGPGGGTVLNRGRFLALVSRSLFAHAADDNPLNPTRST
jgi:hypothetical protein